MLVSRAMESETDAEYRDWETAPEHDRLVSAIELVKSRPSEAVADLERLAESTSKIARWMATYNLAVIYQTGDAFGEPNYAKAEEWWRRSADEGYRRSEFELGCLLRRVGRHEQAMAIFMRLATIEYAPSMRMIGVMYFNGEGVPRDLVQARHWWERSIRCGNLHAKALLVGAMVKGQFGWSKIPAGVRLLFSLLADAVRIAPAKSEYAARML